MFYLIGIGLGIALMMWGCKESKLNENISEVPQKVTVAELEKGDYTGSNFVEISDFVYLYSGGVVYGELDRFSNDFKSDSKVDYVYLPVVSQEHPFLMKVAEYLAQTEGGANPLIKEPTLEDYTVLVKTRKYKTFGSIPEGIELAEHPVEGIFINKVSSLKSEEKKLLAESVPGLDFDKVLILEDGREPSSETSATFAQIGGGVIIVVVLVIFFKPKKKVPLPEPQQQGITFQ